MGAKGEKSSKNRGGFMQLVEYSARERGTSRRLPGRKDGVARFPKYRHTVLVGRFCDPIFLFNILKLLDI